MPNLDGTLLIVLDIIFIAEVVVCVDVITGYVEDVLVEGNNINDKSGDQTIQDLTSA